MKITCCNKCEDRHSGCHANCEEYKRQKELLDLAKKEREAERAKRDLPDEVLYRKRNKKRGQA